MEVKKERYRLNLSLSSRLRAPNQNLQFIVNLMFPINAVLHGFLNPCNRSLGVSVADIGPGLIITSVEFFYPIELTITFPHIKNRCSERLENKWNQCISGKSGQTRVGIRKQLQWQW